MKKRAIGTRGVGPTILDKVLFKWLLINHIDANMVASSLERSLHTMRIMANVAVIPISIITILAFVLYDIRETITIILYIAAIIFIVISAVLYIRAMKKIRYKIKEWMDASCLLQDYHIHYPQLYCERIRYMIIYPIISNGRPSTIRDSAFLVQQMKIVLDGFDSYATNRTDFNDDFFNAYSNLITTVALGVAIVLLTTVGIELLSIEKIVLCGCLLAAYISVEFFSLYIMNQNDHVFSILANRCANDLRMAYEYVIDQCEQ